MHSINCRFCNAEPSLQSVKGKHVFGGTPQQHFYQCHSCKMIYLYPPLKEEEEAQFYREEFEKFMTKRAGQDMDWSGPEQHFQSNRREIKRRMPFLEEFIREGQNALEIGCSSGFMLSALKEKGLNTYGIDPSGGFIEYVRSKGIPVYNCFEDLKKEINCKFDLIIHYYVLEHIRHPVEFLEEYGTMLAEGGRMIFEVPCASDPLIELYQISAFDKFYWSVAHHWYFNKLSLTNVLKKTKFKFELFPEQRYDISNHMVWMMDGKPGGLGRYNHIFEDELNNVYKRQLKKH